MIRKGAEQMVNRSGRVANLMYGNVMTEFGNDLRIETLVAVSLI